MVCDVGEFVFGLDIEDGVDSEVGVDDIGVVQWVECDVEIFIFYVLKDWFFFGVCVFVDVGVVESFEEEFVGEYVNGKLFVVEGVYIGSGIVRCSVDFEGDGVESFFYVYQ